MKPPSECVVTDEQGVPVMFRGLVSNARSCRLWLEAIIVSTMKSTGNVTHI